jgi:hypothetical protein
MPYLLTIVAWELFRQTKAFDIVKDASVDFWSTDFESLSDAELDAWKMQFGNNLNRLFK